MKRIYFALGASLSLFACSPLDTAANIASVPAPIVVADRTVLDEQAILAVETGYKAFRLAVELGADAGMIKGARATQLAAIDQRAYDAVKAARTAYRTGNAASYQAARIEARSLVEQGLALIKGN